MSPVRVLHIVTYMGLGGLETMLMNYYRRIDRSKLQFDFLVHRDFEADYDAEIRSLGGRIYRLPRLNPFSPAYRHGLNQFFRDHSEYKIIHSHLDCMAGIPLKAAARYNVPIRIAHAHSSSQSRDYKYPIKLWFRRMIPKYATNLFACSHLAGDWMFSGAVYKILPNAIDLERFKPNSKTTVRQEFHISEQSLVVGHIGRFVAEKNHRFLLEIFHRLTRIHPDVILLLVGEGGLMEQIKKQAIDLGISHRVIFAGPRTDVPELLNAMDVFLFPSSYEGLPVSVIEAQAVGLPCVLSDAVSPECCITPWARQFSLSDYPETWAKAVLCASGSKGHEPASLIRSAGFDIQTNAALLQECYLSQEMK